MSSSTSPLDKVMIGQRLAAVRARADLSQERFAESLGVSKRAYLNYERGEREAPLGLIKAVHDLYGIDVDWLMSGPDATPVDAATVVDFRLISQIVGEIERQLAAHGRELKDDHRARLIKALYLHSRERGNFDRDAVVGMVAVAVARGR